LNSRQQIVGTAGNWQTQIQGTGASLPQVRSWTVDLGSFFDESSVTRAEKVAVLGAGTRDQLFGEKRRSGWRGALQFSRPRELFNAGPLVTGPVVGNTGNYLPWAISADGQRFLLPQSDAREQAGDAITVVLNARALRGGR
jgi:hypothetical protein